VGLHGVGANDVQILGMGNEIIECLRVARMIERHGERFLCRVFTAAEIAYCQRRHQASQHFSAHWAGKEAVLAALGSKPPQGFRYQEIEIRSDSSTDRQVLLHGPLAELQQRRKIIELKISLAHCRSHATALVLALGEPTSG
tara:strand:+ start:10907 stop:11332 length:426 start_codon:yes stop_codon:yes gene_type:complete